MPEIQKRSYPFKFLGFSLAFTGPAQADDVERIVGEKNAVINGFMQQYCFHDRGPKAKEMFAERLEAFLNNDNAKRAFRMEKPKRVAEGEDAGAEVKKYTESAKEFYDRLVANNLVSQADAERIAREVNEELGEWSVSTSTRKPGAEFYALAKDAMARIESNPAAKDKFVANVEKKLHLVFADAFGEVNLDNVARVYKALDERKKEEARQEALSMLDDGEGAVEEENGE